MTLRPALTVITHTRLVASLLVADILMAAIKFGTSHHSKMMNFIQ